MKIFTQTERDVTEDFVSLSKAEALDLITLLTAQLAGAPLRGQASGACPTLNVVEGGVIRKRVTFAVKEG